MIRILKNNKKIIIALATAIFLLGIFTSVHAQTTPPIGPPTAPPESAVDDCGTFEIGCILASFLNKAAQEVLYWIFYAVGVFISFAAGAINTLVVMSGQIMTLNIVKEGFRILLAFANLGFVLAIIFVAFSTILRTSGYETKTFLYRLIVAAVLVNFSFAIAGVVIDFDNVIGFFFIEKSSPDNLSSFATSLASSFNPQQLLQVKEAGELGVSGNLTTFGSSLLSVITSLALSVIFAELIAIVFFAIAVMFLIRLLILAVLLIVMPLAWLSWVVPGLNKYWSQWWNNFLRWNFFLPAVTFFLYLGVLTATSVDTFVSQTMSSNDAALSINNNLLQSTGAAGLITMLIKIGVFVMALWAGNAMGIAGSKGALTTATNIKNKVLGSVTGTATGIAKIPYRAGKAGAKEIGTRPTKAGLRGLANLLNGIKIPGTKLTPEIRLGARWFPGAKGAISKLSEAGSRKAEVEEYRKKYLANLTQKLWDNAKRKLPVGPVARSAFLEEAVARKDLKGLTEHIKDPDEKKALLQELVSAIKATNAGTETKNIKEIKEILDANPQLAPTILPGQKDDKGKPLTDKEVITKQTNKIKPEKILDVEKDAFDEKYVVLGLSSQQIGMLFSRENGEKSDKIQKIRKQLEGMLSSKLKDVSDKINNKQLEIAKTKTYGTKAEIDNLKRELKALMQDKDTKLQQSTEEEKDAFKQYNALLQRIINPSQNKQS